MAELKKCPFCGSKAISLGQGLRGEDGEEVEEYYGECLECACTGPAADTEDDAEALWNKRKKDKKK